jgi:hypothetical protein
MATLRDRLAAQVADRQAERQRIDAQYASDIAEVDDKIATLQHARRAISDDVETAYTALIKLGLIQEIK